MDQRNILYGTVSIALILLFTEYTRNLRKHVFYKFLVIFYFPIFCNRKGVTESTE